MKVILVGSSASIFSLLRGALAASLFTLAIDSPVDAMVVESVHVSPASHATFETPVRVSSDILVHPQHANETFVPPVEISQPRIRTPPVSSYTTPWR
jgi:hypothetical protein